MRKAVFVRAGHDGSGDQHHSAGCSGFLGLRIDVQQCVLAALLLRAHVPAAGDVHLDQVVFGAAEQGEAVVVLPAHVHAPARDLQPAR